MIWKITQHGYWAMVSVTFLLRYLYGGKGKIVSLIEITIQKDLLNSRFSQKKGGRALFLWLCAWAPGLPWTMLCSSFPLKTALRCVLKTLQLIRSIFYHYGIITFNLTRVCPPSISVKSLLFLWNNISVLVILPIFLGITWTISPSECQDLFVSLGGRKIVLLGNEATKYKGFFFLF